MFYWGCTTSIDGGEVHCLIEEGVPLRNGTCIDPKCSASAAIGDVSDVHQQYYQHWPTVTRHGVKGPQNTSPNG